MRTNTYHRFLVLFAIFLLGSPATGFPADSSLADVTYGDGALSFSAGFIRHGVVAEGVVAKTPDNKSLVGRGDLVYLRMNRSEEVHPGNLYTLYRQTQKVFHPATRRYMGELINVVGVVQVTKISHDFAVARIERSYGAIVPGNGVMAFTPPHEEKASPGRSVPEVPGMIVEMQFQRTLIGQHHHVYVDWGREDGLGMGDRLQVFRARRGLPDQMVGEVKVVALEDRTAAGVVTTSLMPFALGDRFTVKDMAHENSREMSQVRSTQEHGNAHQILTTSLASEISRGDVIINQEGDKIKINLGDLVDQLEYEPGHAPVKPSGLKILKQISDVLKTLEDQHIQVEGHTDSMPVGPSLMSRYPSNQELSEARANLIVRYFMEEGLDPSTLSAVGYADKKPVASNAREDGRRKNRRIEIELSPKTPSGSILLPTPSVPEVSDIPQDPPAAVTVQ